MAGKASTAAPFVRLSPFGFALPARINAIVGAGIVTADPRVRRRRRFGSAIAKKHGRLLPFFVIEVRI